MSFFTDMLNFGYNFISDIFKQASGIILGILIFGFLIWFFLLRKKTRDFNRELYLRHVNNIRQNFRFKTPKTLALCQNIDSTLNFQTQGKVVGMTGLIALTEVTDLHMLVDDPNKVNFEKLLEEHKDEIDANKIWLQFLVETSASIPIIQRKKQTLFMVKPYQILSGFDRWDNKILIKGNGCTPIADGYTIVTDELGKTNYTLIMQDLAQYISHEGAMFLYGNLGSLLETAIKSDTNFYKSLTVEGARVMGGLASKEEVLQ